MSHRHCPFCGNEDRDEMEVVFGTPDREGVPTAIACMNCGAHGPWKYVGEEDKEKFDSGILDIDVMAAMTLWNARHDTMECPP